MAQPQSIYLHIGLGKTGSSYIQSSLALSADALRDRGICYPSAGRQHERALAGDVNVGNLPPTKGRGFHTDGSYDAAVDAAEMGDCTRLVFSNEGLFSSIVNQNLWPEIRARAAQVPTHLLLFIRDPLDHALSAYKQGVKGGLSKPIEGFLEGYAVPRQVDRFLDLAGEAPVTVTVRNYSRHRKTLLAETEAWLDLAPGQLAIPAKAQVNRSLTRAEECIQIAFNRHVGRRARLFVADALSNELPHIRSEMPYVAPDALAAFLDRMQEMTAPVNARLPEGEGFGVPTPDEARALLPDAEDAGQYSLTEEQIEVLARNMASWFKPEYKADKP
ncbi:hypothetical protein [Marinibacterium sp. SX1]|uniref:hypothetical protein n=1 Tax=Marinibacterium sp. SX1 TaxID=3388424 RepID=UPI003D1790E9